MLVNPHIRIERLDLKSLVEAGYRSPSHRRPVANASFALNHLIHGLDVSGYHVVNIAIHVINGLLVYLLCIVLLRDLPVAGNRAGAADQRSATSLS